MSETDFKTWKVPESPLAVEYSPQVVDEIRLAAFSGLNQLSRGGFENAGVLFGDRGDNLVRILTWRPMACRQANGSSFQLSEADKTGLGQQLLDAKSDPELSVLHPVGWFVSHTRGGLSLTATDLEIYTHFFPWSWQITLVVQPFNDASAHGSLFARGPDGSLKTELLPPLSAPAKPAKRAAPAAKTPRKSILADNRLWLWAALLALASIVAAVLIRAPQASPPASISFQIADSGGELQFAWDKNAKPVREAVSGALDIRDGASNLRVPLDAASLREGAFPYARKSGDLQALLTVYPPTGSPIQESARFLAPSAGRDETARLRRERDNLAAQVAALQKSLRKETNLNQELERKMRLFENKAPVKRARRASSNHRSK